MMLCHRDLAQSAVPLWLPPRLQRQLEITATQMLQPAGSPAFDFASPQGEAALVPHDSISWRVFRNPVALFVGGVTAVLLELAEPRVRSGVWDHTSFRTAPRQRLQRTGLAAMVTVYGARSVAEHMIAGVARLHARVQGRTPAGTPYSASDPELLRERLQLDAGAGLGVIGRALMPRIGAVADRLLLRESPSVQACLRLGLPEGYLMR